jgi:phage terminase small subunit
MTARHHRITLFVEAYLETHNAAKAAIAAGYSRRSAKRIGYNLLRHPAVISALRGRQVEVAHTARLRAEDVLTQLAAIVHADIRRVFHPDGRVKMPHELDAQTAAAISLFHADIVDGVVVGARIHFWNKVHAIEKAMKHLGLFERDHAQGSDVAAELLAHVARHNQALAIRP